MSGLVSSEVTTVPGPCCRQSALTSDHHDIGYQASKSSRVEL